MCVPVCVWLLTIAKTERGVGGWAGDSLLPNLMGSSSPLKQIELQSCYGLHSHISL